MNPRIEMLRKRIMESAPSLDIHRARIVTQAYREAEGEPVVMIRARALAALFDRLPIGIAPGELIVGGPTLAPRAAQVFPEVQAGWAGEELEGLSTRAWDPLQISAEDRRELTEEILPFWKGRTVSERVFRECPPDTAKLIYDDPSVYPPRPTGLIDNFSLIQKGIGTTVPNYDRVLTLGVKGLLARIEEARSRLDLTAPQDVPRMHFLKAAALTLEGLVGLAGRYAALARRMAAEEPDPGRRAELRTLAEVCERVPFRPPRNFQEALQSFWFTHLAVRLEESGHSLSPGRFDQYLSPFYGGDRHGEERERALELLECLFLKFSELMLFSSTDTSRFYTGAPQWQNLNLGGRTAAGRDATNDLSHLCLEAMMDLRIVQPDLSVRIHADTPEAFLLKACRLARLGTGHPKFYNEDLIAYSMGCKGLSVEESRDFAVMGCVEPRARGEGIHLTGGFINLPAALELTLNDGVWPLNGRRVGAATGDPRTFATFEQFMEAFKQQCSHLVRHMFIVNAIAESAYCELLSTPFLSALTDDCIAAGRDLQHGGARHNFGPAVNEIGIADTADSLAALEHLVFDRRAVSMEELLRALADDFAGHAELRARLIHEAPKFGNDDDRVDRIGHEAVQFCNQEVMRYRNPFGGRAQAGIIAVTAGIPFGKVVGALPSGRKAGEPLADNASPASGRDRKGPTATLRSVAKLDPASLRNGTLLNLRLSPAAVRDDEGLRKMAGLVRGLCDVGCWHAQFNVVDTALLRRAQEQPEDYSDLLVRVAGYSAHFTQLHAEVQEEIIRRTEYGL